MSDNHRDFTRVQYSAHAEVDVNGHVIAGDIADISMNSIFLHSDVPVQHGDDCEVRIYLGESDPLELRATGQVTRSDEDGFAVRFNGLYCESYDHLRKVVLLNTSIKETAKKEMQEHLGIATTRRDP